MLCSLHDDSQSIKVKLSILPKLPTASPPDDISGVASEPLLKGLNLADPHFGGKLDILLGGLDYTRCITGSLSKGKETDMSAQPTLFGWTVLGPMAYKPKSAFVLKIQTSEDMFDQELALLWDLERTPENFTLNSSEDAAVMHFNDTHSFNQEGRYVVQLPRIENPPSLGESRAMASRRYFSNEKSLKNKGKYREFQNALLEYIELGHAESVPPQELHNKSYYLPVHSVFKDSSTTTTVRPVFDASARSSNGISLNDIVLQGPNFYPLLTDISQISLLRHRGLCRHLQNVQGDPVGGGGKEPPSVHHMPAFGDNTKLSHDEANFWRQIISFHRHPGVERFSITLQQFSSRGRQSHHATLLCRRLRSRHQQA